MHDSNGVSLSIDGFCIATVEIRRPPNNFFDVALIAELADVIAQLDEQKRCRAIILCSEGKHFCAGANLGPEGGAQKFEPGQGGELYRQAARIFNGKLPIVAAVQGAAIGGGLGLACAADFRVASTESRFAANFALLGFHHGFGLTVTLPRIVGQQNAQMLLYTGHRVQGAEALEMGLCDRLVAPELVRSEAHSIAVEIARAAPLAVQSIRETMRGRLAEEVVESVARENAEQERLRQTDDFTEGIAASAERREPNFVGQ